MPGQQPIACPKLGSMAHKKQIGRPMVLNPQPAANVPKMQSDGERPGTTIIVFNSVSVHQQQQHPIKPELILEGSNKFDLGEIRITVGNRLRPHLHLPSNEQQHQMSPGAQVRLSKAASSSEQNSH
ncbi:hypothetical protein ACLOJK_037134 [Asimina triloba]